MIGPQARVRLMSVELDRLSERETIARVMESLASGRGGWLATPNLDQLRQAESDPEARALLASADLAVADGMPLVWASRLMGDALPERVAGSDLIFSLSAAAAKEGRRVRLVGGAGDAGARAGIELAHRNPGLAVGTPVHVPMDFDPADANAVEAVRVAVAADPADLIYVGLGFPKQERLISVLRKDFASTWFVGVGVAISFVAGDVPRAPRLVRSLGLEWAHRLAAEPRRLARRYLVDGLPFAARLFAHALRRRLRGLT